MAAERTILFEHIPKTAGSTVNFVLNRYYPKAFHINGFDPLTSIEEFKHLNTSEQRSFRLVHGHCALELESFLDNPLLITFLRHPVDQFLSQFFFIKEKKKHISHKEVSRFNSIEAYIHYAISHFQDNLQCRVLARNHSWIKAEEADIDRASLYLQAKEKLNQFDLVLLTEHFDESLLLLRQKLGWTKWPYYFRANKTPNRPLRNTIDPILIRQIEALQVHDMKLYHEACQRFEAQIREHPIERGLAIFQRKNRFYQSSIYPLKKLVRTILGRR